MMAASEVDVSESVNKFKINGESTRLVECDTSSTTIDQWGFSQEELYRLALSFYKGN